MAQHYKIENFKDEKWYKKVMREIEKTLGKKGTYYSIFDLQTNEFLHTGRNSKSKVECATDSLEFFEDLVICPCGTEMFDYEQKCEDCGYKVSTYIDKQLKLAETDPDQYIAENQAKIIKHEFKIQDDLEDYNARRDCPTLTELPSDYAYQGGTAYMFQTKYKHKLAEDEDFLRICDCGIEIHIGRNIEPSTQIYIVA